MRSEGKNTGEEAQTLPVSLRLAGADDEGFLFQVYAAGRRKEMESWGLEGAQLEAMLNLQFRAQRQHYEIAFEGAEHSIILSGDRAIGRMLVYRSQQEIRLVDIALLPDYCGKGIGGSLINQLQAEAQASSKPLTLHVDQSNRAARLYERLGFEVVADRGTYFMMKWTSKEEQPVRRVMMIENATLETFAAHINSKFWLQVGQADRLELELVKALDVGSSERQTQFSLTFRAPENAPLIQGIYRLEHANLGEFDIFLVPIGKDEEAVFYEAVFNRIVNR